MNDSTLKRLGTHLARFGAHDARRDGRAQVEGRTDGQHPLAQPQRIGRTEGEGRQLLGLDLQQGDVRRGVLAHERGVERASVVERRAQLRSAVDHVVVRHDVAVGRNDDARTAGPLLAVAPLVRRVATPARTLREAEEFEEGVVAIAAARWHLDALHGLDVHHRLHCVFGGIRKIGIALRFIGGEVRSQCGRAFHLPLDIGDRTAALGHRPRRHAARSGRNGDRSQD